MKKPRVLTKCVANYYTGPQDRIIEFSFPGAADPSTGGLISFRQLEDGRCRVEIYRCDPKIVIVVPRKRGTR